MNLVLMQKKKILKGTQPVIPAKLHHRVVQLAHEGHQGMSNTKSFIRSKVWFPNIDKAVEEFFPAAFPVRQTNRCTKEPLCMSELPRGPWLNLSVDFCGPLPTGEHFIVIDDENSRYPVVEKVRSTSADCVIPVVDRVFAMFGLPEIVKTDRGPRFQSGRWKKYMKTSGIKHRKITPRWPQANAQAESFKATNESSSCCTSAKVKMATTNNFSPHLQEYTTHFNIVHSIQTHV